MLSQQSSYWLSQMLATQTNKTNKKWQFNNNKKSSELISISISCADTHSVYFCLAFSLSALSASVSPTFVSTIHYHLCRSHLPICISFVFALVVVSRRTWWLCKCVIAVRCLCFISSNQKISTWAFIFARVNTNVCNYDLAGRIPKKLYWLIPLTHLSNWLTLSELWCVQYTRRIWLTRTEQEANNNDNIYNNKKTIMRFLCFFYFRRFLCFNSCFV